jgi:phage portal protein BeeE
MGSKAVAPIVIPAEQMVHYAPTPDPEARWRGMSWLSPVIEEIRSDKAATVHKGRFFDNAATPNLAVKMPLTDKAQFLDAVRAMDENHKGASNAYKTMWLMGGADVTVVGNSFKDLDYKAVQGAGETRIAAAAGVPPIIVGLSEGLDAAAYGTSYGQARRAFADLWARPAWREAAASLQKVLQKPNPSSQLWYDETGISFLQEDQMDAAEILSRNMLTVESGVRGGFKPDSVVAAVEANDLRLMEHTGLYSVQLQPPGANTPGRAALLSTETHEVVRYVELPPTRSIAPPA